MKPKLLKLIFFSPLLFGCQIQNQSKISKTLITKNLTAYEKNSCTFTFDQGPLLALVGASDYHMVNYIEELGVDIFAVPQTSKGCRNFSSVPQPPDNLKRFFQDIDRAIGGGALLGLFLSESRVVEHGGTRPVIMIRDDANGPQ